MDLESEINFKHYTVLIERGIQNSMCYNALIVIMFVSGHVVMNEI